MILHELKQILTVKYPFFNNFPKYNHGHFVIHKTLRIGYSKILDLGLIENLVIWNIVSGSNICQPNQLVLPFPGALPLQSNFQVQDGPLS